VSNEISEQAIFFLVSTPKKKTYKRTYFHLFFT